MSRRHNATIRNRALWQKNAREAMKRRATELGLSCFKCGSSSNEWAKTGVNRQGHWAICVPCVQDKRTSSPA